MLEYVYETSRIFEKTESLVNFLVECKNRGFKNNETFEALKWSYCLDNGGAWYATHRGDKMISISGIHPFQDGYRALFRGAQLEPRAVALNRYHMQSYCFHGHLPYQIEYARGKPIYITTNLLNDSSGKMLKIDKVFTLLSTTGIVDLVDTTDVFNTIQNIWRLNVDAYLNVRKRF